MPNIDKNFIVEILKYAEKYEKDGNVIFSDILDSVAETLATISNPSKIKRFSQTDQQVIPNQKLEISEPISFNGRENSDFDQAFNLLEKAIEIVLPYKGIPQLQQPIANLFNSVQMMGWAIGGNPLMKQDSKWAQEMIAAGRGPEVFQFISQLDNPDEQTRNEIVENGYIPGKSLSDIIDDTTQQNVPEKEKPLAPKEAENKTIKKLAEANPKFEDLDGKTKVAFISNYGLMILNKNLYLKLQDFCN